MATLTKGRTFINGEVLTPQKLNELVDLASVSNIANADIASNAAIADTKLATISTANKVANSATTATNANTASAIVTRDASGNFSAGTITANLTGTASTATTATTLSSGAEINYPRLVGVREAIVNVGSVSGTQTLNLQQGNIFQIAPSGNVTIAFSNIPASGTFVGVLIRHQGTGTARTYTWPANTKWAYGETPDFTSTNGKFDIVSLFTYDGGTNWFGQILGQNY